MQAFVARSSWSVSGSPNRLEWNSAPVRFVDLFDPNAGDPLCPRSLFRIQRPNSLAKHRLSVERWFRKASFRIFASGYDSVWHAVLAA